MIVQLDSGVDGTDPAVNPGQVFGAGFGRLATAGHG
jgi:hypothetical protein